MLKSVAKTPHFHKLRIAEGKKLRKTEKQGSNIMEKNQNGYPRTASECAPQSDPLDSLPLAYSYTPIQRWRMMYRPEEALSRGTLFEELYKPKEVYGYESKRTSR